MKWILKLSDDTERTKNETTDMKRLDIRTVSNVYTWWDYVF